MQGPAGAQQQPAAGAPPQGGMAPQGAAATLPAAERLVIAPAAEEQRTVPAYLTLWAIVQQQANLNLGSFNALLQATGLYQELDNPQGSFTVFAPTDDGFISSLATLPNTDLQGLLANPQASTPVVQGHIVQGKLTSRDLADGMMLQTLNPQRMLQVIKNETGVFVMPSGGGGDTAQIIFADTLASNGYMHAINKLLLWPGDAQALERAAPSAEGAPIPSFVGGAFAPTTEMGVTQPVPATTQAAVPPETAAMAPQGAAAGGTPPP